MCEKESKRRSCTTCPKYDGMKCTAANMLMGDREQVLQEEHRRGFICVDTGEAELRGDGILEWTAEQERLRQEKGYKSCEEMWDAEDKQVKCGFHINEDNEELEPMLQVFNAKATEIKEAADKAWAQYNGLECRATDAWQSNRDSTPIVADSADLKEVTVSPPMPEHEVSVMFSLDEGTKTQISNLPGPVDLTFQYEEKEPGSPSSECPSRREGPPQKGKIDENNPSDAPLIPGGTIVAGEGIQVIENPGPMWKDTSGYWEPVRPRSCTNCKLYNDPICMKIGTHIGTRAQIRNREDLDGFQCIAALPKEEWEAVITSNGCNNRKEIC